MPYTLYTLHTLYTMYTYTMYLDLLVYIINITVLCLFVYAARMYAHRFELFDIKNLNVVSRPKFYAFSNGALGFTLS